MPPDTPPALSPSDGPAARRGRRPPGPGARGRPRPRRGGRRRHRGAGEAGAEPDRQPDQRAVPGQHQLRRRRARQDAERPQLPARHTAQDRRRLEPDHPHHHARHLPAVALQGRARGPHERRPGLRPRRHQPDRLPGDLAAPRPDGRFRPDGDAADGDREGPGHRQVERRPGRGRGLDAGPLGHRHAGQQPVVVRRRRRPPAGRPDAGPAVRQLQPRQGLVPGQQPGHHRRLGGEAGQERLDRARRRRLRPAVPGRQAAGQHVGPGVRQRRVVRVRHRLDASAPGPVPVPEMRVAVGKDDGRRESPRGSMRRGDTVPTRTATASRGRLRPAVGLGCLAVSLLLPTAHPRAGGFIIYEMGTTDLGTASAGRAAIAKDAPAPFGKPAGQTPLPQAQIPGGGPPGHGGRPLPKDGGPRGGGNGGNAQGFAPGGALYGVYSATPDLKFGLSLGSYFGGSLQYQDNWSGRFYSTKSELLTFGAFPTVAYRINRWLSVGVGAQILYGKINEKVAVPNVTGGDGSFQVDQGDVGYGGMAGVLLEPTKTTRFGVTYTSQVDFKFKDTGELTGAGPLLTTLLQRRGFTGKKIDLSLTVPQQVMASAYHEVTDRLAIMANVDWQDWSRFGEPEIQVNSVGRRRTLNLDYDDTWGFALGAQYKLSDPWTWSVGFAYDTSPLSKSQRTPAIPLDQQWRVGTGLEYRLSQKLSLGLAYEYLNLGDASMSRDRGPAAGKLDGKYSTNEVHFIDFTISYKF